MILRDTTISVVCDEIEDGQHKQCYGFAQFGGIRTSEVLEKFRAAGWDIDLKADRAVCPQCRRRGLHRGSQKLGD